MEFFGIGLPELVVILVLTLIVVGPQRLPEVAAQIGRTIRDFRRYSSGVTKELMDAVQDLEREYQDLKGELRAVSGEMRDKAEAFGRELTGVAGEIKEKLEVEGPSPKAATTLPPPADNGSSAESPADTSASTDVEAGVEEAKD